MNTPYESQLAMCLLTYVDATGESHIVWNSIDKDPDEMICLAFGVNEPVWLQRDPDIASPYAPDHRPEVGDLVIVDHTPDAARFTAAREYDRMNQAGELSGYPREQYIADHLENAEIAGFPTFCIPATDKLCRFFRNLPR